MKNKKKNEVAGLHYYGLFHNIMYLFKFMFQYKKITKLLFPANVVLSVLRDIVVVAIPSIAVYAIENKMDVEQFLLRVGGIILLYGVICVIQQYVATNYMQSSMVTRVYGCFSKMIEKTLTTDYINRELFQNQKLIAGSADALNSNWVGVELTYKMVPNVIINMIGVLLYGGAIVSVDVRILLVLILMFVFNIWLNSYARGYLNQTMEENKDISRKQWYIQSKATNLECGKDARLFRMETWFYELVHSYVQAGQNWQKRIEKRFYIPVASDTIFIAVRDCLAYIILIHEVFDEMVNDKTAIYISHRMSSCRFCDNIVVFDQGEIIQMGSHESLANTEGRYKELWEAQSQYYK